MSGSSRRRRHRALSKYSADPLVPIGAVELRVAMRRCELEAHEIAARARISQQRLWSLKSGKVRRCRRSVRAALAKALSCRVSALSGTVGIELIVRAGGLTIEDSLDRQAALDSLALAFSGAEDNREPWLLVALSSAMALAELADAHDGPEGNWGDFTDGIINLADLRTWKAALAPASAEISATEDELERFASAIAEVLELAVGANRKRSSTSAAAAWRLRELLPPLVMAAIPGARAMPS